MARNFNGTSDYITAVRKTSATANVTLSAFVYYIGSISGNNFIFGNSAGGTNGYSMFTTGARPLGMFLGGVIAQNSGLTLAANTWQHVAMVSNSSGIWTAYLNAVAGPNTAGPASTPTNNMFIGSDNAGSNNWEGYIAEPAYWSAQLTVQEISAIAFGVARPGAIRPQNLLGWWKLDGYNHPALDSSLYAQNGTLHGTSFIPGPLLLNAGPPVIVTPQPKAGAPPPVSLFSRVWSPVGTRTGTRQLRMG